MAVFRMGGRCWPARPVRRLCKPESGGVIMRSLSIFCGFCVAVLPLCCGASDVGVFGSYYTQDGWSMYGGGVKMGVELAGTAYWDVRGTYSTGDDGGGDVKMVGLGAVWKIPAENVVPYIGGGGAVFIYNFDMPVIRVDPVFGFYGLVGLEVGLGGARKFFVEAAYVQGKIDQSRSETYTGWMNVPGVGRRWGTHTTVTRVTGGLDGFGGNAGIAWEF